MSRAQGGQYFFGTQVLTLGNQSRFRDQNWPKAEWLLQARNRRQKVQALSDLGLLERKSFPLEVVYHALVTHTGGLGAFSQPVLELKSWLTGNRDPWVKIRACREEIKVQHANLAYTIKLGYRTQTLAEILALKAFPSHLSFYLPPNLVIRKLLQE